MKAPGIYVDEEAAASAKPGDVDPTQQDTFELVAPLDAVLARFEANHWMLRAFYYEDPIGIHGHGDYDGQYEVTRVDLDNEVELTRRVPSPPVTLLLRRARGG